MEKQPDPIAGIHNSQWVQCPGNVTIPQSILQDYTIKIISRFKSE